MHGSRVQQARVPFCDKMLPLKLELRCHDGISNLLFMFVIFQGKVVVIRGEGPKGGPGMLEMLTPTTAIMGAGLKNQKRSLFCHL